MLRRLAPLIVAGLLVACGGDDGGGGDGGGDDTAPEADGPEIGDHFHAAFGIYACGEFLAPQDTNDPLGIHTHADGLIHVHPFDEEATGENARLGLFLEAAGVEVDNLAEATNCPEAADLEPRLLVNGEEVDTPPEELPLREGQIIILALAPADEEIPDLPWADRIDDPGDV